MKDSKREWVQSQMNRIREVIKQKSKEYHERRVFCEHQAVYFNIMMFILIGIGLFIEYGYYSTIGHLGPRIAFEILKIHVIKLIIVWGYAFFIDLLLSFIVGTYPKTMKDILFFPFKRPTFLFTLLLILMLSLDAPFSVFCISITAMAIFSQNTKKGYTFYHLHPVLIGYFISVFGILITNYNLGLIELPPMLTAPYMEVTTPLPLLTYHEFIANYYSLMTVVFGIFEGSLCFTLIIPLLLCALFLSKRKIIDYHLSLIYFTVYAGIGTIIGLVFDHPYWIIVLFLLNGSILVTGIFILPDLVTLERYKNYKYLYCVVTGVLSVLSSYFVHFMFAPYLALALVQLSTLFVDIIKKMTHLRSKVIT